MKSSVAKQIRTQMLANGKSEQEIESVLKAYREYKEENKVFLSSLLRQEKRNRFSCVNEKETATMPILLEEQK